MSLFRLSVVGVLIAVATGCDSSGSTTSSPPATNAASGSATSGAGTSGAVTTEAAGNTAVSISDPAGDARVAGVDITRATAVRHPNGDLDIQFQLKANHVKFGFYMAWVTAPGGGVHQVGVTFRAGLKTFSVLEVPYVRGSRIRLKSTGAAAGDFITMTALASDLGWPGHGHYKVSFQTQDGDGENPPTDKAPRNSGHGPVIPEDSSGGRLTHTRGQQIIV